ncbi:ABC transporter [Deinococcus koreensis]|uniref:ABC transporter n=1 Tax=Deinococcus koreensis TaxID=2054903 RepID=A0A2K3UTS0_9DEIO|nr:ABC transporter [Deinococcus koreensis]
MNAGPGLALRVEGVSRSFGGVRALREVSLDVPAGARHAVIGPNGAGKSTLFRVVSGEAPPSAGAVSLDGRTITGLSPGRLAALGLARSFQTSSLFPQESVLDNVVLAALAGLPGRRQLWRPLSGQTEAIRRAQEALAGMGLAGRAFESAATLSHGEMRQLELAMVLAQRPRLLLLDEPLAGLSAPERERVANLILNLPRDLTLVLIEHDLAFCLRFADRITVLSGGEEVATGTPDEIRASAAVQAVYVGAALERPGRPSAPARPAPLLRVGGLGAAYGRATALQGVSLEVGPGEVLAVLGRNGMGKTTLLTTLMGWRPAVHGTVTLAGQDVTALGPAERSRAGMALVPQGRRMLAGLSVDEELRLAARPGRWTLPHVYETFPRLHERRFSLSTTLSGGEQQMVAIGRALLQNPAVLLLDEPTEGLSPQLVGVVQGVLLQLRGAGETVLLAEQNLDLALAVADRVCVLDHGALAWAGDAAHLAGNRALVLELLGV